MTVDLFSFIAVAARITGFLAGMPFIGEGQIPKKYKVFLALGMTVVLLPVLPAQWLPEAF
jgi:flagellar biosynthesis protein FliR